MDVAIGSGRGNFSGRKALLLVRFGLFLSEELLGAEILGPFQRRYAGRAPHSLEIGMAICGSMSAFGLSRRGSCNLGGSRLAES